MNIKLSFLIVCVFLSFCFPATSWAGEAEEFRYARQLHDEGVYDLAAGQCEQFRQNFPGSERLHEVLQIEAEAWFALGDFTKSRQAALRLSFHFPESPHAPNALLRNADCLAMSGQSSDAAKALMRLADFYPDSPLAPQALLRAEGLLEKSEMEERRALLHRLIRKWPDHQLILQVREKLGELYGESRDTKQAVRQWQKILNRVGPGETHSRLLLKSSDLLLRDERPVEALALLEKWLPQYKKSPQRELIRLHLLQILGVQDRLETLRSKAKVWWPKGAIQAQGQQSAVAELLGDVALRLGNYSAARLNYELVTPSSYELAWKMAWVLDEMGTPSAGTAWSDLCESFLGADSLDGDQQKLFLAALERSSRRADQSASLWNHPHLEEILRAMDPKFPLPQGVAEALLQVGKGSLLEDLLSSHASLKANGDDRLWLEIQLAQSQGDFRLARQLVDRFNSSYYYSPLLDEVQAYFHRELAPLTNSLHLNQRLLALMARQNAGGDPRDLSLAFGQLYLDQLNQPEAALQQFRQVQGEASDSLTQEALWGEFQALLTLDLDDEAMALSAANLGSISNPVLRENFLLASLPGAKGQARLQPPTFVHFESLSDSLLKASYHQLQGFQEPWVPLLALQCAFLMIEVTAPSMEEESSWLEPCRVLESRLDSTALELAPDPLFARACVRSVLGNEALAQNDWRRLAQIFPKHSLALRSQLRLAASPLLPEDERNDLLQAVLLDHSYHPMAAEIRLQLSDDLLQNGDPKGALILIEQLLGEQRLLLSPLPILPTQPPLLDYKRGLCLEALGEDGAREAYGRYLQTGQRSFFAADALLRLAHFSETSGDVLQKLSYLEQVEDRLPLEVGAAETAHNEALRQAKRLMAHVHASLDQQEKTFQTLEELRANESGDADLRCFYLRTLYLTGRHSLGKKALKAFLKEFKGRVDSDSVKASVNLAKGRFMIDKKEYDKAAASLRHVLKHFPDTPHAGQATLLYAQVLSATGQDEKALELLQKPRGSLVPLRDRIESDLLLGTLLRIEGEYQPALRVLSQAVSTSEENGELHRKSLLQLIVAFREAGFPDGAIRSLRQYIQTFPEAEDRFSRKMELALLLKEVHEYDRAIQQLQKLLPLASLEDEAALQFYIAECTQEKGEFRSAILHYMKVPYLGGETRLDWDVTALYQAGRCHEELAEIERAIALYQRIVRERGPGSDYGKAAQDRINTLRFREGLME